MLQRPDPPLAKTPYRRSRAAVEPTGCRRVVRRWSSMSWSSCRRRARRRSGRPPWRSAAALPALQAPRRLLRRPQQGTTGSGGGFVRHPRLPPVIGAVRQRDVTARRLRRLSPRELCHAAMPAASSIRMTPAPRTVTPPGMQNGGPGGPPSWDRGSGSGLVARAAEDAQEEQEQVDEVEVQGQRPDDRGLLHRADAAASRRSGSAGRRTR